MLLASCTPLTHPPGPRIGPAQLARAHFVAADGAVLPVRSWLPKDRPPQAVLVALHGFNDYSRAFAQPGEYLSAHGIAVYAYDQRGFGNAPGRGLWAGSAAYADDLAEFTAQLRQRYRSTPLYILGESMGGAVAIVAMTSDHPPSADGLILSAPAVWARDTMPWYQRALLFLTANLLPGLELTGEGLRIQASDNLAVLRGLGSDPLVIKATRVDAIAGLADLMDEAQRRVGLLNRPVLVLYGEKDQVIPKEPVYLMLRKLLHHPEVRIGFYEGGYHLLLRDLGAAKPLGDIAAWIADRSHPLPSGAEQRGALALAKF
ncbi:alpha/beta hydrolase [Candidatus Methylocalor cossyra]|uniref:alpha/beta hydrolase n=1 Tax=Candidatus Methylocalor cossyra TaxID=3108543 RepID=UPI0032B0F27C